MTADTGNSGLFSSDDPGSPGSSQFGVHISVNHRHVYLGRFVDEATALGAFKTSKKCLKQMTPSELVCLCVCVTEIRNTV